MLRLELIVNRSSALTGAATVNALTERSSMAEQGTWRPRKTRCRFKSCRSDLVDVCKRTGGMQHTAKLTPNRYGAYCYDGDNKKPVRNPRQSGETGNLRDADGRSAAGMTLTSTPTCSRRRIDTFRPDSRTTARVT